jgi:prepilin-type N-terminal cleavage/methylation domain-containing protein
MYRHSASNRTSSRSAYTLIEVLLALVILTILMSMASSPLMQSWRDQRTGSATEDVRALLAGTRILALDRDETWQFVYEPGGTRYVRVPQSAASESSTEQTDQTVNRGKQSGTLPPQITFGESGGGAASTISSDLLAGLSDAGELSGISWSAPVIFYSDGTSSEATFEINDEYGNTRTVSVRELTGGVTVKDGTTL